MGELIQMAKALYVAYFTGVAGQSIGLFYIGDGMLVGVDVATMQYHGSYQTKRDGSLEGVVEYAVPAGATLITGAPAGVAPTRVCWDSGFSFGLGCDSSCGWTDSF
jgi:hypothetical protein